MPRCPIPLAVVHQWLFLSLIAYANVSMRRFHTSPAFSTPCCTLLRAHISSMVDKANVPSEDTDCSDHGGLDLPPMA